MRSLRKELRGRHPLAAQVARLGRVRRGSLRSETVAELGSIGRDRRLLAEARRGRDVCWLESDDERAPLVTIRIATRDRPEKLIERAVASSLAQTYENLDVLVVGDACDQRTEHALRQIRDERVRYVNLPRPGAYPTDPLRRWHVAGSKPMNVALDLAAGEWIAPCDDDDELTPDHVEKLLDRARSARLELVWSKAIGYGSTEAETGTVIGDGRMARGAVCHGSIIYSMGLSFFRYSMTADRLHEPGDWNLLKRMRYAGVRMGYLDEITYRYWPAGAQQYTAHDVLPSTTP